MDNTFIQYYDSNDNLLYQGICQYKHPCVYYENCMDFVIGQEWFIIQIHMNQDVM